MFTFITLFVVLVESETTTSSTTTNESKNGFWNAYETSNYLIFAIYLYKAIYILDKS